MSINNAANKQSLDPQQQNDQPLPGGDQATQLANRDVKAGSGEGEPKAVVKMRKECALDRKERFERRLKGWKPRTTESKEDKEHRVDNLKTQLVSDVVNWITYDKRAEAEKGGTLKEWKRTVSNGLNLLGKHVLKDDRFDDGFIENVVTELKNYERARAGKKGITEDELLESVKQQVRSCLNEIGRTGGKKRKRILVDRILIILIMETYNREYQQKAVAKLQQIENEKKATAAQHRSNLNKQAKEIDASEANDFDQILNNFPVLRVLAYVGFQKSGHVGL
ncbi:MAG: hypothetical protein HUJ26_10020, partial [Planctomycetaceae bacterium]|nr:hypothetical protein [Planctomycetaceae bacterium]